MESRKRKALIMGGVLLVSAALLTYTFYQTDNTTKEASVSEVSLRANTDDISVDDILKNQENKKTVSADASADYAPGPSGDPVNGDDPAAVARVQALIRANEDNLSAGMQEVANERQGIASLSSGTDIENNSHASSSAGSSRPVRPKKKESSRQDTISRAEVVQSKPEKRSAFNSISLSSSADKNAIKAYVHSEQTVMAGSTLKMRLGEDAMVDGGILIPKNSPVFGEVTSIDGERVNVRITHVNYQGNILPFEKLVYSKDALLGIYVPGNPKSDANKDVTGGVLDGLPSNIPGLETASQIAGAVASSAVAAGKQAVGKNVRKIKVTIKTNYEIYLRPDEKK